MTAKELWQEFAANNHIEHEDYEAWAFGGNPNLLAELALRGIKTATASAYPLYELDGEPIPHGGVQRDFE